MSALSLYCSFSALLLFLSYQDQRGTERNNKEASSRSRKRTVAAEFVEIRLAIALAFARLCVLQSSNHNSEKALESRGLAQEGLNIALEFMNRARFTDSKLKEVTDQIMAVEKLLYLS